MIHIVNKDKAQDYDNTTSQSSSKHQDCPNPVIFNLGQTPGHGGELMRTVVDQDPALAAQETVVSESAEAAVAAGMDSCSAAEWEMAR